jgi:ADP-ribose pyrophosphatase YjhB (NUDIX family)
VPNLTVATIIMKDRANVLLAKPREGPDAGLWALPDELVNDGESVRNTAIRGIKDNFGLETDPKMTLFICERVQPNDHRIGVFVLSEPTDQTPFIVPQDDSLTVVGNKYSEAKWADVRALGEIQRDQGMSEFTVDAFVKFSGFLQSQVPVSGSVN